MQLLIICFSRTETHLAVAVITPGVYVAVLCKSDNVVITRGNGCYLLEIVICIG